MLGVVVAVSRVRRSRTGSRSRDPAASLVAFGARVRELREIAGMTQQEVADAAGIHRVNVSKVESGSREVGVTTVVDLAAALGVEVAELFRRGSPSRETD